MKRFLGNEMQSLTALGFGVVLALSIVAAATVLWQLDRWSRDAFRLVLDASKESEYVHIMRDSIRKREISILKMMNTEDVFERDEERLRFYAYAAEYAQAREEMQNLPTTPEMQELFLEIQQSISQSQPYNEYLVDEIVQGDLEPDALRELSQQGRSLQQKVLRLLNKMVLLQRERHHAMVRDFEKTQNRIAMLTALTFVVSIIVAFIVIRISTQRFSDISRLTIIDGVTGTYNRRYFDLVMEEEWKRSMREKSPISLIMIDIDFFKAYNDKYGHQMGDICLYSIAKILGGQLKRASDFIARYGGEEFVIVLPNTNTEHARLLAERLRLAVEEARISAGKASVSKWVTISAGAVTAVADYHQPSSLLIKMADQNLYKSKRDGRNRITISELLHHFNGRSSNMSHANK
ncbi:MAG: diguanylate cyclase [Gammaproteobacteria bacterium]|nr:MAG: diguanylate cyclase [Gammaproteobacteria bacterium]